MWQGKLSKNLPIQRYTDLPICGRIIKIAIFCTAISTDWFSPLIPFGNVEKGVISGYFKELSLYPANLELLNCIEFFIQQLFLVQKAI